MNHESIPITEFDSLVSPKELNIIKASLPYINGDGQKFLSIFVKLRELTNTIKLMEDNNSLSMCANDTDTKNLSSLIKDIKNYINKKELDTINTYMNTINTISMYNEYMSVFSNIDNGGQTENNE